MRRALIVDDLAGSRAWLRRALTAAFDDLDIVEADTVAGAKALLQPAPWIALVDLRLPDGSGVAIIEKLRVQSPDTMTVVATVFDDDAHLFPALRAGAQGYVLKDQPPEALAEMLKRIADGHPPLSPSIARRLLMQFHSASDTATEHEAELSARETDVLRLVAKGYTAQEVADAFGLSRHTVSGYLKDVYRKLSVNTRAEATIEAARRGLVLP